MHDGFPGKKFFKNRLDIHFLDAQMRKEILLKALYLPA